MAKEHWYESAATLQHHPRPALLLRRPWLCLVGRGDCAGADAITWLMNTGVRHTSNTAYDPRCAYFGRPVLGAEIWGRDGVYHPACTQPPQSKDFGLSPYYPPYGVTHPVIRTTGDPLTPANFTTSP